MNKQQFALSFLKKIENSSFHKKIKKISINLDIVDFLALQPFKSNGNRP